MSFGFPSSVFEPPLYTAGRLRECRIAEVPAAAAAAVATLEGIDDVLVRQVFVSRLKLEPPIFGPISCSEKFADSVLSPSEILGYLN